MSETAANRVVNLLLKEQREGLSPDEKQELNSWTNSSPGNLQFIQRCADRDRVIASLLQLEKLEEEGWKGKRQLYARKRSSIIPIQLSNKQWRVAAVWMALLMTAMACLLYYQGRKDQSVTLTPPQEDRLPGTSGATLTLSDGHAINLKDLQDGQLKLEEGEAINKQGEQLIYATQTAGNNKRHIPHHAVATAVGGFYALTLPDKTKVWLNATSRIRYPTHFAGTQRRVEVSGEVYFEVVSNSHQPFVVVTGPIEVKVVGTHFNVRNYHEEKAIQVTLLEGVIQVKTGKKHKTRKRKDGLKASSILRPGQQAYLPIMAGEGKLLSEQLLVQQVDISSVIAWKSGVFDFRAVPFANIMHELKRWYPGIDSVDMRVSISDKFTATISKDISLLGLLSILRETSKVNCTLHGNIIRISR